ncbi:hypothetical protein [Pseudomonas sp. UMAB-40]|uniref:hypothetical protein n=1 Tax=Pseudomonas sp. UMAB-40 TaxID=1365407 RepID=UPI001C559740|nr:hypothetical protein [Pseudomonas sp. UMAB-40]
MAILVSGHASFEPLQLFQGDAWLYRPRELAHFIGYAGSVMIVWSAMRFYTTRAALWVPQAIGGLGVATLLFYFFGSVAVKELIGALVVKALCQLLPLYLGGCYVMDNVRSLRPGWLKPMPALTASVLLLVSTSLLWEVLVQPLVSVYGGPPRGHVQLAQLTCDFAGIAIGWCLAAPWVRQIQSRLDRTMCLHLPNDSAP